MQAKPNSIWFQNEAQFAQWQKLKQASSIAALSAYEKKVPGNRAAWQFINPLHATLLYCEPAQQRVHVEMKTKGYMQGTDRFLYSTAIIH